jgi:hypothetical protein
VLAMAAWTTAVTDSSPSMMCEALKVVSSACWCFMRTFA